ncbi:MAG: type I restriction enzyme HsdR N-terminal domain-containing protein [Armatimonadota bacterium]
MGEIVEFINPEPSEVAGKQARTAVKRNGPKWEIDAREKLKASIKRFNKALVDLKDRDANEADTRLFVTDVLCDALGLDKYTELCTEYRVKGEYVDYGIRLENDMIAFVEVKRINTKLGTKHLRQVQNYAVNEGVEWIILTNGAQWQVYHLSGGLPLITDLAIEIDLLGDIPMGQKVNTMFYLTRDALKRGKLMDLWQEKRVTAPNSLARILLSDSIVIAVRKELKKATGYNIDPTEIVRLVKETCLKPECFEK